MGRREGGRSERFRCAVPEALSQKARSRPIRSGAIGPVPRRHASPLALREQPQRALGHEQQQRQRQRPLVALGVGLVALAAGDGAVQRVEPAIDLARDGAPASEAVHAAAAGDGAQRGVVVARRDLVALAVGLVADEGARRRSGIGPPSSVPTPRARTVAPLSRSASALARRCLPAPRRPRRRGPRGAGRPRRPPRRPGV